LKLIFIIGNAAVGKMTVGQELAKITDLRLFHNHMMIEPVLDILGYFNGKAIARMREVIFEEFANSKNYGLIFTYMWAFDQQADWEYVEDVCNIFRKHNADIYYVELIAPQAIRLQRNATENRLINKASKRDVEMSNERLINDDNRYRCVSNDGEIPYDNYIKIDNSNLSAENVAQTIKERFGL
jgi:cytidylate kinase